MDRSQRAGHNSRSYAATDALTTAEVARWLRRSERTVLRLHLPQIAAGRYLFGEVIEALKARRLGPEPSP
jgi:hypothetical protein